MTYSAPVTLRVADVSGDGYQDLITLDSTLLYNLHQPQAADFLASVTDGFQVSASFTYAPMTDASVYTKGSGAQYPEMDLTLARRVVKQATLTDGSGSGSIFNLTFGYEGARQHLQGRGFLGFAKRTVIDSRLGLNTRTEESYLRSWPYTGLLAQLTLKQASGSVLRNTVNTWSALTYSSGYSTRQYPYIAASTTGLYEVSGTHYATVTTTLPGVNGVGGIHAPSGLIVDATSTTTEIATGLHAQQSKSVRVHHSTVFHDDANWCIGRPDVTQLRNSHTLPGGTEQTRTIDTTWDGQKCRPTQQVLEPGNPSWSASTALAYDSFGNVSQVSVTGAGMSTRSTALSWGSAGVFPEQITNALSQTTYQAFRYDLGVQTSITDPNGLTTSFVHDDFGRQTRQTLPDDARTTWTFLPYSGTETRLKYFVSERLQTTGAAPIRTNQLYLDQYDRVLYDYQQLANGSNSFANLDFDARGRLLRRYNPRWSSSTGYWQFEYDVLDRPTSSKLYSAAGVLDRQFGRAYQGLLTTTTDAENHQTRQYVTAWGDVTRVQDAALSNTDYEFDPFGSLTAIKDPSASNITSFVYNVRGMRTGMIDADLGTWTYLPNALGELERVRDPKTAAPGWTTTMGYDPLGRMTTRHDVAENVTSTFAFGTPSTSTSVSKNVGRLISITTSNASYAETLTYDAKARLSNNRITTDAPYDFDYDYDSQTGLPATLTYPTSTSGFRFKLRYDYAYGYLSSVRRFDAPSTEYWRLNSVDARGNVVDEAFGNGLKVASASIR